MATLDELRDWVSEQYLACREHRSNAYSVHHSEHDYEYWYGKCVAFEEMATKIDSLVNEKSC